MINRTKTNISQGSFHLLFWGWLITICSLSEYLLYNFTEFEQPYWVWYFVIPGVLVSLIYGFIKGRSQKVYTYADRLYMWVWIGFMVAAIILFVFLSSNLGSVGPYILLLAGYPTFISGVIIKFRPLLIGGVCFWALSVIAHFAGPSIAPLAVPVAMVAGYLIPGYLLKKRVDHDQV
jgi:hypothetical protein